MAHRRNKKWYWLMLGLCTVSNGLIIDHLHWRRNEYTATYVFRYLTYLIPQTFLTPLRWVDTPCLCSDISTRLIQGTPYEVVRDPFTPVGQKQLKYLDEQCLFVSWWPQTSALNWFTVWYMMLFENRVPPRDQTSERLQKPGFSPVFHGGLGLQRAHLGFLFPEVRGSEIVPTCL